MKSSSYAAKVGIAFSFLGASLLGANHSAIALPITHAEENPSAHTVSSSASQLKFLSLVQKAEKAMLKNYSDVSLREIRGVSSHEVGSPQEFPTWQLYFNVRGNHSVVITADSTGKIQSTEFHELPWVGNQVLPFSELRYAIDPFQAEQKFRQAGHQEKYIALIMRKPLGPQEDITISYYFIDANRKAIARVDAMDGSVVDLN